MKLSNINFILEIKLHKKYTIRVCSDHSYSYINRIVKKTGVIMRKLKHTGCLIIITLCSFFILQSCAKKKKQESLITLFKVSGSVELLRKNQWEPLKKDTDLKNEDILRTGKRSTVSILVGNNRIIYLNKNTKAKMEYVHNEDFSEVNLNLGLEYGEVFSEIMSSERAGASYAVSTKTVSVVGKKSCFNVRYYRSNEIAIVKVFEDQVTVFPNNQNSVEVTECNKILVKSDGSFSRLVSLTEKDVDELCEWVTREKVESIIAVSQCISGKEEKVDLPPIWKGKPKKHCKPGIAFTDEVSANDPEGTEVQYFLLKGPVGMKIAETEGVIHYEPRRPGTFEVRISAEDEMGNSSVLQYFLTVIGNLNAVLKIPESVKASEEFEIDGSLSVNGKGKREGLSYRFDVNNDGIWDYPGSGEFSKESTVSHSYEKPGEYTITLQVKDLDEKTAIESGSIDVSVPPAIQLSYTPVSGTVGTEFTLSVIQPKRAGIPSGKLMVRWDLNGDGRWDYPGDGSFTDELEIRHMWDKPGTCKVTVEAEDESKNRISVSKDVKVYKGITIEELRGPDTVNINENFTVTCIARDPEFALVEYAWDFAGVGMFSKKSKKPSINFSYKEAGIYTLVCCVTNERGMSASEAKKIFVLNSTTTIDAGGPYKTNVNVPLTVEGFAKDVDNKIVSYFWDFDNDKKFEWISEKTPKAEHVFPHRGSYVIRFGAKADDGTVSEDTALVTVINRPPQAIAGENIVWRKNKKLELNGIGRDPDGNIVKYEWDFDGDGHYDWSSKDTGFTEHIFEEYSYAVFKVTDSEGASATDSVNIVICPKGMVTIQDGKYCIDKYEWPNKKEQKPVRQVTYKGAAIECLNVRKRLCTAKEMETACKGGKTKFNYPYGRKYEAENCNTYGNRHINNQVANSGEFPNCESHYGVFDMSGNVAEWTMTGDAEFKYVVGGWWHNGEKRATCSSYIPLKKDKKYLYVGFRCCK